MINTKQLSTVSLSKLNFLALIISYFYFSYLKVFSFIPYHILFLVIGVAINVRYLKSIYLSIDKDLIYVFGFMLLITIKTYFILSQENFIEVLLRHILLPLIIIYYISSLVKSEKDIFCLIKIIIYVGSFSMIIAVLQFFQFDFAWEIRKYIQFSIHGDIINTQLIQRVNPSGLAYYSITYSYHALILASIFFSRFLITMSINNLILFIFGLFGLAVSNSASAFYGFIIATFFYILFTRLRSRECLIIFIGICIFVFFLNDFLFFGDYARLHMFKAAFYVLNENFFVGIGNADYNLLASTYFEGINAPAWWYEISIHNSFLIPLVRFGIFMLIPFLLLYYFYIKCLKVLKKKNTYLHSFLSVYLISYSIHAFFHNAGMFNKDQLFWILFGFLVSIKNVYKNN
jgi:hypothetical protein